MRSALRGVAVLAVLPLLLNGLAGPAQAIEHGKICGPKKIQGSVAVQSCLLREDGPFNWDDEIYYSLELYNSAPTNRYIEWHWRYTKEGGGAEVFTGAFSIRPGRQNVQMAGGYVDYTCNVNMWSRIAHNGRWTAESYKQSVGDTELFCW